MSNTEPRPAEQVCVNGPQDPTPPPGAPDAPDAPAAATGTAADAASGLRDGVTRTAAGVELLEPRDVPLGGPRAMTVRRTLPQRARSLVGAWCFLDFYGPDDLSVSTPMRVPRHPHTGLATVSWLFSGRIDHIDSAGNWATVRPGEVALMTAGRGITHSEYSSVDTTTLHGAQLWYALPEEHRFTTPRLDSQPAEVASGDGWRATVFLGELLGVRSPVPAPIPLTGAELRLDPGAELEIDVPAEHEHALLHVTGAVALDGVDVAVDHLAVVDVGRERLRVTAGDEPVIALLLGGRPLGEQIVMWWNFVGRSHEEIAAYRAAYQAEMGFEAPEPGSPLLEAPGTLGVADDGGRGGADGGVALGEPVHGALRDALAGSTYDDGRPFPQFGDFPPGQEAPLPAPELPGVRMQPRG